MLLVHKDSMAIALTIKILVIKNMNADPRQSGHQISKAIHLNKVTFTIGITTQGIVVITIKNMEIFLRIALEHILEVTIRDG